MKKTTVLIPTYNRTGALAVTLTSLSFQTDKSFDIVIADQSEPGLLEKDESLQTAIRLLETREHKVEVIPNLPSRGLAHQRHFLLQHSHTPYSLFLDDDMILEPFVIYNMRKALEEEHCGFVGSAVIGLSYTDDVRPHQQNIEFWEEKVLPEVVIPKSNEWERYVLHNAANVYHVQEKFCIKPEAPRKYKVAWVGGCVIYDTAKLRDVGAFNFWEELPVKHCGEDVLAQLRVMKKYGGCGILPSGVYHQELETAVKERKINAPEYLQI